MNSPSRAFFLILTSLVSGLALHAAPAAPATNPPLNVLFIMSDQHNARALGCYGNPVVKTPNLDALAAQGALFERAICQSGVCVPSRYSIWTGRHARSTGTYGNSSGQNPAENTVAELLHAQGYISATIGKHHMEMTPANNNHGWDVVEVLPPTRSYSKSLPYEDAHPGRDKVGESSEPNEKHNSGLTAQATIKFIREHKDKPFVVWCSFYGPHTPICVSKPWSDWYDPAQITLPPTWNHMDPLVPDMESFRAKSGTYHNEMLHRQTMAYYYGAVSQIDYNIGEILRELDRLGLSKNTIVVYTADHGEMMGEHGMWTKGGTGYEPTIRVPMLLRLPGVVPAGRRVQELACSIDVLPTLLDAAKVKIPANIQGRSLIPLTQGKAAGWRKYAVSELGPDVANQVVTITNQAGKYITFRKDGKSEYEQLFDRTKDEWETTNLIADPAYAPLRDQLKKALAEWEAQTETRKPVPPRRTGKRGADLEQREGSSPPAKTAGGSRRSIMTSP